MDTVDAGWFVDPLGTYCGRFFDGDKWTEQVSDRGTLQIDQAWRAAVDQSSADDSTVGGTNIDGSTVGGTKTAGLAVADYSGARSRAAGQATHGYNPVIPTTPIATQCGGRNDQRQVQIPVKVDRRRNNRSESPQGSAKQNA